MIVRPNKTFETNSLFRNLDWYNEDNYVIDETKEENQELIAKIKAYAPYMELVIEDEQIIDIIPLEKPPTPPKQPKKPTQEEYLLDLDYRLSIMELGL